MCRIPLSAPDATVVVSRRATTVYGAVHMLRFLHYFKCRGAVFVLTPHSHMASLSPLDGGNV